MDVALLLAGAQPPGAAAGSSSTAEAWPPLLRLRHESIAGAPDPGDLTAATDVADTLAWTPCMATALVLASGGTEQVVGRVVSPSDRLSARRAGRNHWPKVGGQPLIALRRLRRDGHLDPVDAPGPSVGLGAIAARPAPTSAVQVGVAILRVFAGYGMRLADRTYAPERWIVAVNDAREGLPGLGAASPPVAPDPHHDPFRILTPPPGREWADPFLVDTDGGILLFVEEWVRERSRGHIAVMTLGDDGRVGESRPVLELGHHVSYPFVFGWDGAWYLMPEQAAGGSLELYRATDFPTAWTWDRTVLPLPAADATIAQIDGTWWLFTGLPGEHGTTPDELHLFHGPSPLGPWQPHPANPVVTDVRTARPAGRLFRHDGAWFRPAQNGGPSYGYSVMILRIERLDREGYRERLVREIEPGWAPRVSATHTLNRAGPLTVIDARLREPRLVLPRRARGDRPRG